MRSTQAFTPNCRTTRLPRSRRSLWARVRSTSLLIGSFGLTTTMLNERATKATGANAANVSYGLGTSAHLAGELFNKLANVNLTHVPYKGAAAAITDLLGGQIEVMFTTVASVAPYVRSGQLRALAVTSPERSPAFPNVPTVAESGVLGYVAESWYGLYVPAGTPADVVERLNGSVARAVQTPALKTLEDIEGLTLTVGPPGELDRYVRAEAARWRDLIAASNIKAE